MSRDTGGQAFPSERVIGKNYHGENVMKASSGMTLRDYFAAKALPVAMTAIWRDIGYTPQNDLSDMQQHARLAYQIADAMLAERSK